MNRIYLVALVLTMAVGASSCQKCATCECGIIDLNFCVDEFDNKSDYQDAVDEAEYQGCDCTEKLEGA